MSEQYTPRRAQARSRKPEMIVAGATALVLLGTGGYAGALLVEMVAASGKQLSELWDEIKTRYGALEAVENSYGFHAELRAELQRRVFEDHELPDFGRAIDHIGWQDGCKVYFVDGSWVTIRFSGTEPVLRVFAEAPTLAEASELTDRVASQLGLEN